MKNLIILLAILLNPCQLAQAASFTYLGTKTAQELNQILGQERKEFLKNPPSPKGYQLPEASSARNEVELYRVEYDSVIPEQDNRPTIAYGLVAIPKVMDPSVLSFVSYQHGTVFGKTEVPSYSFLGDDPIRYAASYETRLAVAQFAGNGYVVLAADYFGMGDSNESEGYLVKASQQQACLDLYRAVKEWLETEKHIKQNKLFLTGWSQGGFVTMSFLQELEEKGIPVLAASTAAGFPDFFATYTAGIYHQRKIDAIWASVGFALAAWSYETYYKRPGLVNDLFKQEHQDDIKKLYNRGYTSKNELNEIILRLSKRDGDKYILDLKGILADKYSDPSAFANSEFADLARRSEATKGYYRTRTHMYYGTKDEVLSTPIAKIAAEYQKAIGNKNTVVATPVENADHRSTFVTAIAKQYIWFNNMNR